MIAPWTSSVSPADRMGYAVAHAPELAWAFAFLRAFPRATVALVGASALYALLGRISAYQHLFISGVSPIRARAWVAEHPLPPTLRLTLASQPLATYLTERTFTPHAFAYHLGNGQFHDPLNALADLRQGILTTVQDPDTLMQEHPLNALRALRLSSDMRLRPSPRVWRAIIRHAPRVNRVVSDDDGRAVYATPRADLVQEGALTLQHGTRGFDFLQSARALDLAFPHLVTPRDHEQSAVHFASVHHDEVRERYSQAPLSDTLRMGTLFLHADDRAEHYALHAQRMHHHRIAHPTLALRAEHVSSLLRRAHALLTENPSLWSMSRGERVLSGSLGAEALSLAHVATLHNAHLREQAAHIAQAAHMRNRLVQDIRPSPLVRGRDLLSLGIAPGHHVRIILSRIRDEQLKGGLATPDEALSYARTLV